MLLSCLVTLVEHQHPDVLQSHVLFPSMQEVEQSVRRHHQDFVSCKILALYCEGNGNGRGDQCGEGKASLDEKRERGHVDCSSEQRVRQGMAGSKIAAACTNSSRSKDTKKTRFSQSNTKIHHDVSYSASLSGA